MPEISRNHMGELVVTEPASVWSFKAKPYEQTVMQDCPERCADGDPVLAVPMEDFQRIGGRQWLDVECDKLEWGGIAADGSDEDVSYCRMRIPTWAGAGASGSVDELRVRRLSHKPLPELISEFGCVFTRGVEASAIQTVTPNWLGKLVRVQDEVRVVPVIIQPLPQ